MTPSCLLMIDTLLLRYLTAVALQELPKHAGHIIFLEQNTPNKKLITHDRLNRYHP